MRHIAIRPIGRSRRGDDSGHPARPNTSVKPSRGSEIARSRAPSGCFKPSWML